MYFEDNDGRIIDTNTGELIDLELIKAAKEQKCIDNIDKLQYELYELGLNSELKIVRSKGEKHQCTPVKSGYTFGKVFRVALRDLMKNGVLSKNARAFIATLEPFIYFPTNSVVVDEGTPDMADLEKLVGLKKSMLYDVLKELEKHDVIKRVKRNGDTVIYFNPFLYCSGAYISKGTFELFKDSKYNIVNVSE